MAETGAGVEGVFSDVGEVHAHGIEQVVRRGIDSGCGDGLFCPADPISRAEMAAWLYRATALLRGAPTPPPLDDTAPEFSDTPNDAWYETYARWAAANDIITADGRTFNPDGIVTRAQAAMMLTAAFNHLAAADRLYGVFADTADTPDATARAIEGIHAAGLTTGCAAQPLRYCPHQPITRAQAATMLARAILRAKPTVGLIVNKPQAARGYIIINPPRSDEVYLIDHLGREVHAWKLKGHEIILPELLENGNLMFLHIIKGGPVYIKEANRDGHIVWEYNSWDYKKFARVHHDFLKLPNGNVLLLMRGLMTPQEAVAAGADSRLSPPGAWLYDFLLEVKPTGLNTSEVVWEWSILDHLIQDHDPDKDNYGPIAGHPGRIDINYSIRHTPIWPEWDHDWTHSNTIDYDPVSDQIMISVRNYSELWVINHNTTTEEAAGTKGDLLYRWGNPRAYGAGDYQDQQLFWQHDAHWIPSGLPGEGNVLYLNNGNEFPGLERLYSSIEEIALPPFSTTLNPRGPSQPFASAQLQWVHTAHNIADLYISYGGWISRLTNGNTLICDGNRGTIFQVTPDGTTVWKYINPVPENSPPVHQGDNAQLRTICSQWYEPNYPGLKDMDLTPKGPIEHYP